MSEVLALYHQLELRLWTTRWRHEGAESAEEDAILDEMEQAWLKLGDEERTLLSKEGPRCWPMEPSPWPPDLVNVPRVFAPSPWPYEGFTSPEDAILSTDAA